jgi:hypothetical protein
MMLPDETFNWRRWFFKTIITLVFILFGIGSICTSINQSAWEMKMNTFRNKHGFAETAGMVMMMIGALVVGAGTLALVAAGGGAFLALIPALGMIGGGILLMGQGSLVIAIVDNTNTNRELLHLARQNATVEPQGFTSKPEWNVPHPLDGV